MVSGINIKRLVQLPPVTRIVLAANIALTLLLYYLKTMASKLVKEAGADVDFGLLAIPLFQLVPSRTLAHPWTLIVSSFLESTITGFILTVLNTVVSIRYFEKVWGSKEMLKFLLVVAVLTNLFTAVTIILLRKGSQSLNMSAGGCFSLIPGFIVAFKQFVPEHNLIFFKGAFHLRIKHVPFILLITILIVSCVLGTFYPALNTYLSFLISWIYLRFFQSVVLEPLIPLTSAPADDSSSVSASDTAFDVQRVRGDASDTFSFAYFFPDVIHPIVSPICDAIYSLVSLIGLVPRFNEDDVAQSNERAVRRSAAKGSGSPGTSSNIAERRRQVALKVLQERIGP